jgi:hypothetical protein
MRNRLFRGIVFTCAVAATSAAAILVSTLWIQPAAVAETTYVARVRNGCGSGIPPSKACRLGYLPHCVELLKGCGHFTCLKWECRGRGLNAQIKEPFRGPQPLPRRPLPWSRIR